MGESPGEMQRELVFGFAVASLMLRLGIREGVEKIFYPPVAGQEKG
jgi:hypothetical protein